MSRTEDAIAALIVSTLGKDAPAQDIRAYRGALEELAKLAAMESELDRLQSMVQVRRALSDNYNED